jgi:hypothetical protein
MHLCVAYCFIWECLQGWHQQLLLLLCCLPVLMSPFGRCRLLPTKTGGDA